MTTIRTNTLGVARRGERYQVRFADKDGRRRAVTVSTYAQAREVKHSIEHDRARDRERRCPLCGSRRDAPSPPAISEGGGAHG